MDKLLLFDLDETLIHSSEKKLKQAEDFSFERFYVYKRPYLPWFLAGISKKYKIGIWSSADEFYVESIVQRILPTDVKLEVMWGNSRCTFNPEAGTNNGIYEKRPEQLAVLKYKKESIVLIDDNVHNTILHQGNSILIKPFTGDSEDRELKHLYNFLMAQQPGSGDWVG